MTGPAARVGNRQRDETRSPLKTQGWRAPRPRLAKTELDGLEAAELGELDADKDDRPAKRFPIIASRRCFPTYPAQSVLEVRSAARSQALRQRARCCAPCIPSFCSEPEL